MSATALEGSQLLPTGAPVSLRLKPFRLQIGLGGWTSRVRCPFWESVEEFTCLLSKPGWRIKSCTPQEQAICDDL